MRKKDKPEMPRSVMGIVKSSKPIKNDLAASTGVFSEKVDKKPGDDFVTGFFGDEVVEADDGPIVCRGEGLINSETSETAPSISTPTIKTPTISKGETILTPRSRIDTASPYVKGLSTYPGHTGYNGYLASPTYPYVDRKMKDLFYRPIVDKKLTIILLEDSLSVSLQKEMIEKIVKTLVPFGLVCFIRYGESVSKSTITDVTDGKNIVVFDNSNPSSTYHLYDAIVQLEIAINTYYMKTIEINKEKCLIKNVEIIGVGTCLDEGSEASEESAIRCFSRILSRVNIETKYFCLSDEFFINAAKFGFHSIGSISRNYL